MSERLSTKIIDEQAEKLCALAKMIWDEPEIGWKETKAVEWTADYLREEGFDTEVGAYGMPTAIRAVWGKGHPVIGFCAEYDCLPGLSQKVSPEKDPVIEGGYGHGCGHNLLGVGCLGACIGLKAELEASGKDGTVIFYGCPAEEQLSAKGFMAKGGAFAECDFTAAWHPASSSANSYAPSIGVEGALFRFYGRTAHAAGNPQDGRSALDALQLMNLGAEFLREHVSDDVRIHYIITNGGLAPNIVPDFAESRYFVRAITREAIVSTFDRLVKCAEGAAHMTETTLEIERLGGIYPTMQNHVLVDLMQRIRAEIPETEYSDEELEFADKLNSTQPQYVKGETPPLRTGTVPVVSDGGGGGSTDYADVMHICPSVQNDECCWSSLTGAHSWMATACSGHSIGMKGMIRAAKIMAAGSYELVCSPDIQEAARAEFDREMAGRKYVCPITDEVAWPYRQ